MVTIWYGVNYQISSVSIISIANERKKHSDRQIHRNEEEPSPSYGDCDGPRIMTLK
jgi:hypothetical protein